MNEVRYWHVVIAGFMQRLGCLTGMTELWARLRRYAAEDTVVELRPWNENWDDTAELIWRVRPRRGRVHVNIYGYSWGGYSSVVLARELGRRKIAVRTMVLSDPVYRHRYSWGQWRALVPWSTIKVPRNVKEVYWFRQTRTRSMSWSNLLKPAGHDLVAEAPTRTVIHPAVVLDCEHTYMDDAAEFKRCALMAAGKLHGGRRKE